MLMNLTDDEVVGSYSGLTLTISGSRNGTRIPVFPASLLDMTPALPLGWHARTLAQMQEIARLRR